MKESGPKYQLNIEIADLEARKSIAFDEMKDQFNRSYESMRPINLLRSTINDFKKERSEKGGFGNIVIGILSGFIVKKIVSTRTYNPIKIAASLTLQSLATKLAEKNADIIKKAGRNIMQAMFYKIKSIQKRSNKF